MKTAFITASLLLFHQPASNCLPSTRQLSPSDTTRESPKLIATGLKNPVVVVAGQGGKVYVALAGDLSKNDDGAIVSVVDGKATPFASGLSLPQCMAAYQQWLFVACSDGIKRIRPTGQAEPFVAAEAFNRPAMIFTGLAVDPESGNLYAAETTPANTDDLKLYRITPRGKVSVVAHVNKLGFTPAGLIMDGASHLLTAAVIPQEHCYYRIKITDGSVEKIPTQHGIGGCMAWDHYGRLVQSDANGRSLLAVPRPGENPVPLLGGFEYIRSICHDHGGKNILVLDERAGTLSSVPIRIPGWEVDASPLPLETDVAFPNLEWTGWQREDDKGQPNPLRPIVLTHAGDGSGRNFVATQHGVIHVFPNDQQVKKTVVFLDMQSKVRYSDKTNEEGFLGLAFHPKYKENGEFFVFYTTTQEKATNVISRFRVRNDDPNRADPNSEEVVFKYSGKPFWNHDGGTICFGPDGYLYITHGDGGAANDPFDNGQKLDSYLGKILRIDVNRKDPGRSYAIPADNPFVNKADAKPEVWAYGLRNVWRMAFDPKTHKLWAADVGQNLFEEINLIERGGNYGWNRREGLHPFGAKGTGVRKEFIEPIWEYHHDVGKSITGGHVYRGKQFPELEGHYLYADYVSARIWALKYDDQRKRVVANRTIRDRNLPILSFGEDEQGEAYLLTFSATGQGIYRIVRK